MEANYRPEGEAGRYGREAGVEVVRDSDVEVVRAMLTGDLAVARKALRERKSSDSVCRFPIFVDCALKRAALARLGGDWTRADVKRYCDRVEKETNVRRVRPGVCEKALLFVLERWSTPPDVPPVDCVQAQIALMLALGGELAPETRRRVLAEARLDADQRLRRREYYARQQEKDRRRRHAAGTLGFGYPGRCQAGRRSRLRGW